MASSTPASNALAAARIVTGALMFWNNGLGKAVAAWNHLVNGTEWKLVEVVGQMGFPRPLWFALAAAAAESVGALLLALGVYTRYAALALSVTMAVAVYRHLTTDYRFETAALYLLLGVIFVFNDRLPLSVMASRRGKKSVD
jgi:putative oxidoreductase